MTTGILTLRDLRLEEETLVLYFILPPFLEYTYREAEVSSVCVSLWDCTDARTTGCK